MKLERALRGVAGIVILISVLLVHYHSPWWLLLTTFMGFNLLQSAFSNWCPMKSILQWLGMKSCEKEIEDLKKGYS